MQFGNYKKGIQIVVDCTTVDPKLFKNPIESHLIIGHNLKFDLQFLYNYGIIPLNVYDTMIIEQLLHLGFDNAFFHYSLHDVALRYLNIEIDKSVRGEIIWRGLDSTTIQYAATDVVYLEAIREKELDACKIQRCTVAAAVENNFVPVMAYLEWCGIKLDVGKWKLKMDSDLAKFKKAESDLNEWLINKSEQDAYLIRFIDRQLSLFDTETKTSINWSSQKQLVPLFEHLGFNLDDRDKKTGKTKKSISEKIISKQKGIEDDFLNKFLSYQEATKVVTTYGEKFLNAINPITGRIHTTFWQLGCASGRMSCGSKQRNEDLSKLNHCDAGYHNLQNLPADEETRSAFVSEKGNLFTSCDYSA